MMRSRSRAILLTFLLWIAIAVFTLWISPASAQGLVDAHARAHICPTNLNNYLI